MRTLEFDEANEDHKTVYTRLIQACNYPRNQGGDYTKQERTVEIQDLLESIGEKYKVESSNSRGGVELVEAIRMNKGVHKLELRPEALFDQLKEFVDLFAKESGMPARDSLKVKKFLDNIPAVKEEEDAKK